MVSTTSASWKRRVTSMTRSIVGRLILAAGLIMVMLIAVCGGTLSYIASAKQVAGEIATMEERRSRGYSQAVLLLERHRRYVRQARFAGNPLMLAQMRTRSEALFGKLDGLAAKMSNSTSTARFATVEASATRYFDALAAGREQDAEAELEAYTATVDAVIREVLAAHDRVVEVTSSALLGFAGKSREIEQTIILSILVALLLVFPISLMIVAEIASRLRAVTKAMGRLAKGKTDITIVGKERLDEVGEMARALAVFRSNAETLLSNADEIRRLNAWFDLALNNMARGLSMFDADRRLVVFNRKYLDIYGLKPDEVHAGMAFEDVMALFAGTSVRQRKTQIDDAADWFENFQDWLGRNESCFHEHEFDNGRIIQVQFQPLPEGGWVDVHEDVTEERRATAKITQLAQTDGLTGLANRKYFHDILNERIRLVRRPGALAVLWLDLDRFKEVNDTYGHPAGDELIRQVAARLKGVVRSDDVVARLGGDEFAIMISATGGAGATAAKVADRAIRALTEPFVVLGNTVRIGVSIGIAIAPENGSTPDLLIRNADLALYRAKTTGKGNFVFYDSEFERALVERRNLENDLKAAIGTDQLSLHYQPIVDLKYGRVQGVEALMRWQHPRLGAVSPATFIPIAEETGLISQMGAWALSAACRDAASWPETLTVAVNLSAEQFSRDDLVKTVRKALQDSGLPAKRLELEVTESLILRDQASTRQTLETLRAMGIGVALDDFGTGYASLMYLRQYPFSKIKIDQSFVRDLPRESGCGAIIEAVVGLARSLGLATVAEGVEGEEHLSRVAAAGCDAVQGYHFSRPVPADALQEVIRTIDRQGVIRNLATEPRAVA